jgi:hypothetical protein
MMRQAQEIKAAYDWMIASHQREFLEALASNDQQRQERLDLYRDHLERDVFVLLFAQFEVAVTESFERTRASRLANPDWTARRGWDTLEVRRSKPPFETRLALTLDRNNPEFREVIAAYKIRNDCAHGRTNTPVGSIDQMTLDLFRWQAAL